MNKAQQKKFNSLYQLHISALHRQGKAATTIDVYSRAVRRITEYFDQCPDLLTQDQLKDYFFALVKSHSWSTVKVDRNGLQFFYKHVLNKEWLWVDIVKPPQKKVLPDILTVKEIERIINGTRELRYQTFILTSYSMGLRLGEVLNLKTCDIDSERMKVHIRQAKGKKDRFVTLPEMSLMTLRRYWASPIRTRASSLIDLTYSLMMRCNMNLASLCQYYLPRFKSQYAKTTNADQWTALNAILGCRTNQYGQIIFACDDCSQHSSRYQSCGHRACNQC